MQQKDEIMRIGQVVFKKMAQVLVGLGAFTMFSACQPQQFGLTPVAQEFGQKVTYSNDVDVLWVIDTSGSMDKHQNLLADQVGLFVNALNDTGLNYHIAVTTMDMSATGEKGKFIGTPAILTPATANLTSVLSQRLRIGGQGSPVERGLEGMKASLSAPLSTSLNKDFLRPNALLTVIFLSNEDDQSTPDNYQQFLDQLRPPLASGERSWVAEFIGVTATDPSCKTSQWQQAGYSEVGTKYAALADTSGGTSESICNADLATALTNVKARVLEVITEWRLDRVPKVESIKIVVDGVAVLQNSTNGWTYSSTTNSVRFHGTSIPKAWSVIKVDYDPVGTKQ